MRGYILALYCLVPCRISQTELHFRLCLQPLAWLLQTMTKISNSLRLAKVIITNASLAGKAESQWSQAPGNLLRHSETTTVPVISSQTPAQQQGVSDETISDLKKPSPYPSLCMSFWLCAYVLSQLPLGLYNLTFLSVLFGSHSHFQIIASLCASLIFKHSKRKHPIVSSQLRSSFLSKAFFVRWPCRPLASL